MRSGGGSCLVVGETPSPTPPARGGELVMDAVRGGESVEVPPGGGVRVSSIILFSPQSYFWHLGQKCELRPPRRRRSIGVAQRVQGRELSYNNLADADAAWSAVVDFEPPAAVIVKHAAPCAIAVADCAGAAYGLARAGDPKSAFGGSIRFPSRVRRTSARGPAIHGKPAA